MNPCRSPFPSRVVPRLRPLLGAGLLGLALSGGWATSAWAAGTALPAAAPAPATLAGTEGYRLGAGDMIRITVYQSTDLSLETRLTEAGTISYPLLGTVHLGGLTLPEAETRLSKALQQGGLLRNPQVSILVTQVRANQVNVLGMVGRPGRYPLDVAGMRLTEVLALVGGVLESGSDTLVLLGKRNGQLQRQEIDVPTLFSGVGPPQDPEIMPGDVVWVDRAPQLYLTGEIGRPGPLRLTRNMTLRHALAAGGGITQRGTLRGLTIHRTTPQGTITLTNPSMDELPQDGDVIVIQESLF